MDHAILSPSASGRWTICTPSARLELNFPDTESDAAREGTLAHAIAEKLLKSGSHLLELKDWQTFKDQEFYTQAMYEYVQDFVNYIFEHKQKKLKSWHSPERKIDLSFIVPESFGHIDEPFVVGNTLHIFDLKYGKGVEVSAIENTQLKIYALGMLEELDGVFDLETVILHIYQPRLNNISEFKIPVKDLKKWGEEFLRPRALLAFAGEGDFVAGPHCHFCKAQPKCKAIFDYNSKIAALRFEDHTLLDDTEMAEVFLKLKVFKNWIKSISDYMLLEALKGHDWPGLKLVEGSSKRKYGDPSTIEKTLLTELHISNMHKPKELLNFEEMLKLIGKEAFEQHITPNLIMPRGKPTVVSANDKRPVFADAATVFADGFKLEEDNEDEY